jgi:mono/diheme cytochrome c family protein
MQRVAITAIIAAPLAAFAAAPGDLDFIREVRPIFANHCFKCHGPEKQKGGLRLDTKAAALKGGDDGKVIVPGRSAESRLVRLVAGLEADKIMPPKGERLTTEEVGVLRAWIDQGAAWPDDAKLARVRSEHWSLQPLPGSIISESVISKELKGITHSASSKRLKPASPITSPVDAFIVARLLTNGLAFSPPADRATLIRRLSFDLIGLPPTPAEIDAFVRDKAPRAYERLVERLLASPRYGERWGRHWLDVARYTESQGFEYDKLRENAWHYRDYVIKSFNEDKPYDRFIKEQIAGDVLEPVTSDGIIGASLLVCGPWDEAGNSQANATQRAITREEEMEDMISVVGQTFLGLTINCARCHSHKFDPIPQEEYYRIKSIFEGVKHGEGPVAGEAESKARAARITALKSEIASTRDVVSRIDGEGRKVAAAKQRSGVAEPGPTPFVSWSFDGKTNPIMPGELKGGAAISDGRLQLGKEGAFYQTAPLTRDVREKTLEAWVALADLKQGGGAAITIENEDGRVFDAIVFGERQAKKWIAGSSGFERTRDLDAPEETAEPGELVHMAVVYRADNSIAVFRNGEPYGKPYTPDSPLQTFKAGRARVLLGMRHTGGGKPFLTGEIKQAALYDRPLSAEEVASSFRSPGFSISHSAVLASLSDAQRAERDHALEQLKKFQEELNVVPPLPVSYAGTRVQPAPTKCLKRGDVKSPADVVTPGALSAIVDLEPEFGLEADAPEAQRRLKFAEWLTDSRNPLPARVMANRVWHFHFGQGLVATPNDFGVSGARPTHPELLDWLAAKFIESGWSVKALHRMIVNSENYRQSSSETAQHSDYFRRAAAVDTDNQLLWHFPTRRLEAEAVRDAMLAVSGQINLQMGGPSFRPFDALKFPANAYVPVDKIGPEFNRRTVYRMNVNSGKEPLLDAFDCPDPSVKTPRRGVTTTPLQALALMNSSFVQRHAGLLAQRALTESKNDLPRAIQTAYRLALGRAPTKVEARRALAAAQDRSLTNVCWALLNSTEFIYVR